MSKNNKYDVRPTVENKGLVVRAKIGEGCTASALKEHLAEVERVTKAHLAQMANYEDRDLLTETQNGLTVVGPTSGEFNSMVAKAHNHAMAAIDSKLAELYSKIAELSAALKSAKK
jgi:hypothetical protein